MPFRMLHYKKLSSAAYISKERYFEYTINAIRTAWCRKRDASTIIDGAFSYYQIATGDMLRAAVRNNTPLGQAVKQIMDSGSLVSDEIIIDLVKERIKLADCLNGFLFDGFPRTIAQADALRNQKVRLDHVINIEVPDEDIITRMSGRLMHLSSGRVYHHIFNPPKKREWMM